MTWGYVAIGGAILVSGKLSSDAAKSAASGAASAQVGAAQQGIEEQRRQFDAIQKLLMPYTKAGEASLAAQQALIGLAGPDAQHKAIDELQKSPAFTALSTQGESAILQAASATGGLRGGDVQGALAQFRPKLLSDIIQQRFQNLTGITQIGQSSAAGVGVQGIQTGQGISALLGQQGAALAGQQLAEGKAASEMYSMIPKLTGLAVGGAGLI